MNNEAQVEMLAKRAAVLQAKKKTIKKIIKKKNPDGSDVVVKEIKRVVVDSHIPNLNDISVIDAEEVKHLKITSSIKPEIVERTAVVNL